MKSTKIPDVSSITLLAKVVSKKDGETPDTTRYPKGMALHELRSPLHGIIGLANTLSQAGHVGPVGCVCFFGCLANQLVINSVVVVLANRLGNITYIYLHIYIYSIYI